MFTIDLDVLIYLCGGIVTVSAAAGIIARSMRKVIKRELDQYGAKESARNDAMCDALKSIIRDRINQAHLTYSRRKTIGAHSLETLERMYDVYVKLGGNSFVGREIEDIRKLKVASAESMVEGAKDHGKQSDVQ